ncbi:hypothetical protein [Chitinophaga sp. LS1]|uniref:hypothetical protein n=1 Tax=Chitinophaga sp. LS1 TaxID=3051176 RepID=UPI002AAA88F2|nr:hypothetical protein [Chitinophaga sp. LS1]WPV65410.1 hypothetical protein QQL36_26775 [Chitinophaga sp. LS1]
MINEHLYEILENEKKRIRKSYPSNDVEFVVIEIIRSLDYLMFMLKHDFEIPQKDWLIEKYRFGWGVAFSIFYEDYNSNNLIPAILFDPETRKWLDNIIQHAGKVEISSHFLMYCKAGLMQLSQLSEKEFAFTYTIDEPAEYYEKLSLEYFFYIAQGIYKDRLSKFMERLPAVREQLKEIVTIHFEKFISYKATSEIDDFYSEYGRIYLLTTQIIDDFDESDVFGGIAYKEYLDFAEDVIMAAAMHRDCCMALAEKTNHQVYLRNILTYTFSKDAFIKNYSESRGIPEDKVLQIVSCFTINKENFQQHLSYPGAPCSPFFELANNILMRSSHGCLDMPVFFLNRELKKRYQKDYFNAVNNREARFKKQLYSLFPDRILKIHENIVVKIDNKSTDIDAIIFDPERKVLGLFQLKWQDAFSTSMQERFSRISNLIPKSVEWIEKIEAWIKANNAKSILEKLKISNSDYSGYDIYLFVISRNHVHFSNQSLDKRAVWASWYQVIEASAKVKDPLQSNPIGEFAAKLRFFSPEMRNKVEGGQFIHDFDYKVAQTNISIRRMNSR